MIYQKCPIFASTRACRSTARALAILAVAALSSAQAQTTVITVTSLNDSGPGTLRAAVAQSASTPSGQTTVINFAPGLTGTIPLGGTLSVCGGQTLTIQGPAASQIAVSGQNTVPVFNLCGGTNVSISNLTVENGFGGYINSYAGGGGIQNFGALTVTQAAFVGNSAGNPQQQPGPTGGAILNLGTLTVVNCTFSGNSANTGGGIANWAQGGVANSTFYNNSASNGGGVADLTPTAHSLFISKTPSWPPTREGTACPST